mmetsp:Transcript_4759/g.6672  ORF Transcript_4759/g.6672 Transcript_4759/m.6672 type:complete len:272 (-) Transcript_4759:65-880(-)
MHPHARDPDIISVSDARGSLLTSLMFFLISFRSTTFWKAPILFDTDPWSKCADLPVLDKIDDCPELDVVCATTANPVAIRAIPPITIAHCHPRPPATTACAVILSSSPYRSSVSSLYFEPLPNQLLQRLPPPLPELTLDLFDALLLFDELLLDDPLLDDPLLDDPLLDDPLLDDPLLDDPPLDDPPLDDPPLDPPLDEPPLDPDELQCLPSGPGGQLTNDKKELHTDKDLDCSSDLLRRIVDSDFAPAWDAKAKSIIKDGLIYFILVLVKW